MVAPSEISTLARKLAANIKNKRRIAAMTPKVIDRGPPSSSVFQGKGQRLGDGSDDVPARVISTMFDKKKSAKERKQRKDNRLQFDQLAMVPVA